MYQIFYLETSLTCPTGTSNSKCTPLDPLNEKKFSSYLFWFFVPHYSVTLAVVVQDFRAQDLFLPCSGTLYRLICPLINNKAEEVPGYTMIH